MHTNDGPKPKGNLGVDERIIILLWALKKRSESVNCIQDDVQSRAVVNRVTDLRVSQRGGFLD
jgi:hypothetical protein